MVLPLSLKRVLQCVPLNLWITRRSAEMSAVYLSNQKPAYRVGYMKENTERPVLGILSGQLRRDGQIPNTRPRGVVDSVVDSGGDRNDAWLTGAG